MKLSELQIYYIAKVCHEANKAWFQANYDASERHWFETKQWEKDSMINSVKFRLRHPDACPEEQHNAWTKDMLDNGWIYGKMDSENKNHPYLLPFNKLAEFQKTKYILFSAIVDAMNNSN